MFWLWLSNLCQKNMLFFRWLICYSIRRCTRLYWCNLFLGRCDRRDEIQIIERFRSRLHPQHWIYASCDWWSWSVIVVAWWGKSYAICIRSWVDFHLRRLYPKWYGSLCRSWCVILLPLRVPADVFKEKGGASPFLLSNYQRQTPLVVTPVTSVRNRSIADFILFFLRWFVFSCVSRSYKK